MRRLRPRESLMAVGRHRLDAIFLPERAPSIGLAFSKQPLKPQPAVGVLKQCLRRGTPGNLRPHYPKDNRTAWDAELCLKCPELPV
jgi:hypothetical protein